MRVRTPRRSREQRILSGATPTPGDGFAMPCDLATTRNAANSSDRPAATQAPSSTVPTRTPRVSSPSAIAPSCCSRCAFTRAASSICTWARRSAIARPRVSSASRHRRRRARRRSAQGRIRPPRRRRAPPQPARASLPVVGRDDVGGTHGGVRPSHRDQAWRARARLVDAEQGLAARGRRDVQARGVRFARFSGDREHLDHAADDDP